MVKDLQKSLNLLSIKEKKIFKDILVRLEQGQTEGLDLKKLKGRKDIFRVRKGRLRVIFIRKNDNINLLAVERRSEKTYKHLGL
jgi:mRNA-degrading endonuclease RelE of RelBE toxin-antitoxin system